jgi:RHS repeat-associated protein
MKKRLISIILTAVMMVTGINLQSLALIETTDEWESNFFFDSTVEDVMSGLPEGAFFGDATWADNSPLHTDLLSDFQSFDIKSYEYIPRAERARQQGEKSTFIQMFDFDDTDFLFGQPSELEIYLKLLSEELYGSETDLLLRRLMLEGYSLEQVVWVYGMSLTLEIDITELLPEAVRESTESSFDIPQEISEDVTFTYEPLRDVVSRELSTELTINLSKLSERNFFLLAEDIGTCADVLIKYSIENQRDFIQMEQFAGTAMLTGIVALTGGVNEIIPLQEFGAPFNYDGSTEDRVNLNSGGLVYETIDYILPGRNGLDLVIGRRYNSDIANVGSPGVTEYKGATATYIGPNPYLNDLYGLGHGWSFMFSSIENGRILHLADGRSIEIRNDRLHNYPLTDLTYNSNDRTFSNGFINSRRSLTYKDGRVEFFCANGKLIGIRNRYNNTILLVHDRVNNHPRITITDTLNRETVISRNGAALTVSLPRVVSSVPNELRYNIETGTPFSNNCFTGIILTPTFLSSYTDPMGIITHYAYNIGQGGLNATSKNISARINLFVNLTTITHPTGAGTHFTYAEVDKNLGRFGLQRVYRVTMRFDRINSWLFNRKEYTYSANNNTGWPQHSNPADLPNNFTYHTVVTTPVSGLTKTHNFNRRHLTTSIVTRHGTSNVSTREFVYSSSNDRCSLPTRITTRNHELANNHLFVETIERFEYDGRGNVIRSWSPLANGDWNNTEHRTTYTYHATNNQLTRIEYKQDASTAIRIDYTLDSNHRHPVTETVFVNNVQRGRTDWTYDSFGNIASERQYINGDNNANNSILTTFGYDRGAYLNSISTGGVTIAYLYDNIGRLTRSTDPRGNATNYLYNARNDLERVTHPDGFTRRWVRNYTQNFITFIDERNNQTTTLYNALGLPTEIREGNQNGTLISRNVYDNLSRLKTSEDRVHNSNTTYTYDHLSRVIDAITRQGLTISGAILAQESYTYNIQNSLFRNQRTIHGETSIAPSIVTTSYVNNMGFEVQTGFVFGTERFNTYSYDYIGNMTEYRSALDRERNLPNPTIRWQYDHAGRITRETNTLNQSVQYAYDALGRNISITDPAGRTSAFQYDNFGQMILQRIPFELVGSTTHFAETSYTYDNNGNLTREQTRNHAPGAAATWTRTDYVYNNRNRLTQVDNYDGSTVAMSTSYIYDAAGNITRQTTGGASVNYTYDRNNNVTRITDALGRAENFVYNSVGNLTSKTDRRGITTTYTYDGLGRLTRTQAGTNTANNVITQSYTRAGQLRETTNSGITITNTYDALGRLTQQSETGGVAKNYTYDLGGNRLTFQAIIGGTTHHTTAYVYDNLNRLIGVNENGTRVATYTYDTNGNRTSLSLNNGVTTTYTYNLANLVTRVANHRNSTVLSDYSYTYFLSGNQREKTELNNFWTGYTYDGLGRLTGEERRQTGHLVRSTTYTYDNRSNRAIMTNNGVLTTYTYNNNNQLTRTVSGSTTTNFTYDNNGNQLSEGSSSYSYDNLNRMISSFVNGVSTSYTYRPDGLRNSKTASGVTTTHVWDGANIAFDRTGTSMVKYIRGINLIGSSTGLAALNNYYVFNANGDVIQLTNSAGTVTRNYTYDAFGVQSSPDANDTNPFRYGGEYFDRETGNYYLRARFYTPRLGRFTQEDPYWRMQAITRHDPQGLNLYAYVMNNPINYTDPTGLWATSDALGILRDISKNSNSGFTTTDALNVLRLVAGLSISTKGTNIVHTPTGEHPAVVYANGKDVYWRDNSSPYTSLNHSGIRNELIKEMLNPSTAKPTSNMSFGDCVHGCRCKGTHDNILIFPNGHVGIDLLPTTRAKAGDPIYAATSGIVQIVNRTNTGNNGIHVNVISLNGNIVTSYLHLSAINVLNGQYVGAGVQIAQMGNTGYIEGSGSPDPGTHLHFSVRNNEKPQSPRIFFGW